ncbi:MAG: GGDEF domain-containing protein [Pseudomonadota bacterium]
MKLRREKDKAEVMVMLNTVLFGVGAGLVTLVWMRSINAHEPGYNLWTAVFNFHEPLLLMTVAILLGGVFHSFTILYPTVLEHRAKQQKALNDVNDFKDQAYRDPLTGLHNRRYFDATLEAYLAEFNRLGLPFGLMVFDVDHFKQVNDTHGHSVGDEVLRKISKRAQSLVREHDIIARIGGEEFAVIIAYVNESQLLKVAERYRQKIGSMTVPSETGLVKPTISIGAVLSSGFENASDLMESVDACLYQAKEQGRDCVVGKNSAPVAA